MTSRIYSKANLNKALSFTWTAVGTIDISIGGTRKLLEGRIGARILILALVLGILTGMVMLIRLTLLYMSLSNWPLVIFSLLMLLFLAVIGLLVGLSVRALRKPEAMEKLYKQSWSVALLSFMFCFPIAADFIVQGRLFYEDAVTTALLFLSGTLGIISGIVMVYESKQGTKQVDQ